MDNIGIELFSEYLDELFPKEYAKDTSLDSSSLAQASLAAYMNFIYNGSEVTRSYHFGIMKQAQKMLVVFASLFSIVTVFLCAMIGYIIVLGRFDAKELIPIVAAVMAQLFSGTLTVLTQKLLKSRDAFFQKNVEVEHFSKILGLIQTVKEEEKRLPFIERIVYGYCDREYNSDKKEETIIDKEKQADQ